MSSWTAIPTKGRSKAWTGTSKKTNTLWVWCLESLGATQMSIFLRCKQSNETPNTNSKGWAIPVETCFMEALPNSQSGFAMAEAQLPASGPLAFCFTSFFHGSFWPKRKRAIGLPPAEAVDFCSSSARVRGLELAVSMWQKHFDCCTSARIDVQ